MRDTVHTWTAFLLQYTVIWATLRSSFFFSFCVCILHSQEINKPAQRTAENTNVCIRVTCCIASRKRLVYRGGMNASQLIIDHYEGAFLMNHIMTCSPLKLDELGPIELGAEARHFINWSVCMFSMHSEGCWRINTHSMQNSEGLGKTCLHPWRPHFISVRMYDRVRKYQWPLWNGDHWWGHMHTECYFVKSFW